MASGSVATNVGVVDVGVEKKHLLRLLEKEVVTPNKMLVINQI
jgi:hypothetical protein